MKFGYYARQLRQQRHGVNNRYSIRQLARRIGVEPTYLSKIERGDADPSEEMILRLAAELGEDTDVLLARAGRVASDIREIIAQRPILFAELIRGLSEVGDEELMELVCKVRNGEWYPSSPAGCGELANRLVELAPKPHP